MYIPEIEKTIARTQANLAQSQAEDQANSTPATKAAVASNVNRLAELHKSLASYKDKLPKGEQTTAGAQPAAVTTLTAASWPKADAAKTSTVSASGPAGASASPSSILSNSSAATQVAPESAARYKEGITVPAASPTVAALGGGAGGGAASSNPVSLASFGFSSGDDTLNLLNMGLLS